MMKRKGKVLSLVLAAILTVSSGSVVQAADTSTKVQNTQAVKAEAQSLEAQSSIVKAVKAAKVSPVSAQSATVKATKTTVVDGSIPVIMMNTGNESVNKVGQIILAARNGTVGNHYQYSQAVTFKTKGTLDFAMNYSAKSDGAKQKSATYGLFYDSALTKPVDSYQFCDELGETTSRMFKVPKPGKYYLGIYVYANTYSDGVYDAWGFVAAAGFYNGADRTILHNKQIAIGQKEPQTNYFKFKATQTGYVSAFASKDSKYSVKVALCNSKKKAYSDYTAVGYNPSYGVTKGKTYYFKVASSYNSNGGYFFKVKNYKVSEKSGKSKGKAVTIKKGKTVSGTLQAGSSQADWYKFKLTSKKSVKILWKAKTNDTMKITVYQGGRAIGTRSLIYSNSSYTLQSLGKWSKGIYYIKVYRGNSKSSGWYSLKWK